jgi:Na+-driven multidrug efflux pump
MDFINLSFVGQLNDTISLAALGLGTGLINVSFYSVYLGLNYALETLAAQSHGAEKYKLAGE